MVREAGLDLPCGRAASGCKAPPALHSLPFPFESP